MLQEDDERATNEDEAQITETERKEELAALQAEVDLPLDDIPRMFTKKCRKDEMVPTCLLKVICPHFYCSIISCDIGLSHVRVPCLVHC